MFSVGFVAASKTITRTVSVPSSSRANSTSAVPPASVDETWRTDHDTAGATVRSRTASIQDAYPVLQRAQRLQTPALVVREMGGQDEERLDERHGEDEERDIREHVDQLDDGPGHEEKRHERENRGACADGYRTQHRAGARGGRLGPALAVVAFGDDALADHQGIVHDEADHQEEADQRPEVQRQPGRTEEQQGADERERDADGNPGRRAQVEHQQEQDEDQDRAGQRVSRNRRQPVDGWLRPIVPDADCDTPRRLVACEPAPDVVGQVDDRLPLGRVDANEHDRRAIQLGDEVVVDEPVADLGDVAQPDDGSVQPRDERNVPRTPRRCCAWPLCAAPRRPDPVCKLPERQVEGCAFAPRRTPGRSTGRCGAIPPRRARWAISRSRVPRSVTSEMGRQLQQRAAHVFGRQSQLVLARDRRRDGQGQRLDGPAAPALIFRPFRVRRRGKLSIASTAFRTVSQHAVSHRRRSRSRF